MQRLDSHVVRTLRGLEDAFLDDGSPLMAGRPLPGLMDVVDPDQEEEDSVSKDQRRRIWQESYRRTGSWRNETVAAAQADLGVGEPLGIEGSKSSNGSSGYETDYSTDETANDKAGGGRDEKSSSSSDIVRDTKLSIQRDLPSSDDALAGLGLLSHHSDDTSTVLPALSFLASDGGALRQGDPRSRLSTLTTSTNSSGSASSSRTSSSIGGAAPPISTTSSTLSTQSQQYLLRSQPCSLPSSPLLLPPTEPLQTEPPLLLSTIPDSPLLSLPTPELPSSNNVATGFSSSLVLRPLSLPIKYNLAAAEGDDGRISSSASASASKRISLGGGGGEGGGAGRRRVVGTSAGGEGGAGGKGGRVGGGGGNRDWRVFGGGGGEGQVGEREVMVWK